MSGVAPPRRLSVIVEADGGARGNPGPAGYGAVVSEAATGEVLLSVAESIGIGTNNVAEYSGLIAGLRAAAELGAAQVEVRMDAKLVIEQMSGRWQIRHPALRELAAAAAEQVKRFDSVRFTWVPRHLNTRADALANAAMDGRSAPEVDLAATPTLAEARAEAAAAPRSWAPPATAATRLILVRHGETERTAQRQYSGRGDVPLTARGIAQGEATARRLSTVVNEAPVILTSPLRRCRSTATEIAQALGGVPVRVEPDLVECDFGAWEGRTFAEVQQRWPQQLSAWLASVSVAPPGGESFEAVAARTRDLVARVLREQEGKTILAVSHVSPIKLILRDALAARDEFLHRLYLDPAGISIVDAWPDGAVAVRTVNDTAHVA